MCVCLEGMAALPCVLITSYDCEERKSWESKYLHRKPSLFGSLFIVFSCPASFRVWVLRRAALQTVFLLVTRLGRSE